MGFFMRFHFHLAQNRKRLGFPVRPQCSQRIRNLLGTTFSTVIVYGPLHPHHGQFLILIASSPSEA